MEKSNLGLRNSIFWLLALLLFTACENRAKKEKPLLVAVSANASEAIQGVGKAFQKLHSIELQYSSGSSGKLCAQIAEGAPYDIFFSADEDYAYRLYDLGLGEGIPETYAMGQLALWQSSGKPVLIAQLGTVSDQTLGMANPRLAPYGRAAQQVMESLGFDLEKNRLITAESIGQVNGFMATQSVDWAITSASSVITKQKLPGRWILVPDTLFMPILQNAVVLNGGQRTDHAISFLRFVQSQEGQNILRSYGYLSPVQSQK